MRPAVARRATVVDRQWPGTVAAMHALLGRLRSRRDALLRVGAVGDAVNSNPRLALSRSVNLDASSGVFGSSVTGTGRMERA